MVTLPWDVAIVPVVGVVVVPSPLIPLRGLKPAWKGTFWPTVTSPSVLSVISTCGVEITFTSLEVCSALRSRAKLGSWSPPGIVMGGPWMPARKPLNEASPATPPSEERPPSSLPTTTGAEPFAPRKLRLSMRVPACVETPRSVSFWRLTSMITASTNTCRRCTSSCCTTLMRLR